MTLEENKLNYLRQRELVGDQRSSDWLTLRHNYITASTSAACAGLMGKVARENMLKEKVSYGAEKTFFGNSFTIKGNLFEPVTNMLYSKKTAKVIHAYALIPAEDPEWGFLGASTDGVTNTLENIEIKTLARRAIGKVKREYYHQMQHQMFCLDLQRTHFIEAKYDEYDTVEEWQKHRESFDFSGVIAEIISGQYVYSPIDEPDPEAWAKSIAPTAIRLVYWTLTDYSCKEVLRDPSWIISMGPLLKQFWEDVLYYREHPLELSPEKINLGACLL
jgi:putative phage-type endonuclease